ncbi:MAG: RnfABCDGE type electron transport complex subunit D [Peptoniphilaceae bacterium]|nr:RnfABCDGE type electron transport complex subunit D [Peptoniphilaceae bacterium]MDY6085269.1 RnfABCDGE type electron transport complex subunit D [Peptoniphilaceae bacterium]
MNSNSSIQAEERLLRVSPSPHIHTPVTMNRIMCDVVIALLPAVAAAGIIFGLRALLLIAVTVLAAVLAEAAVQKIRKQPVTTNDFTAIITGILLAFNLPATFPLWKAALAAVFAIVVAKQLFGGLGRNFINPALAGRAFLMASWPGDLSKLPWPFGVMPAETSGAADVISAATPLSGGPVPSLFDMFIGNMPGMLGEVSALALLIGAAFLLWRGVISLRIPLGMILSFVVFTSIFGLAEGNFDPTTLPQQVLSGGLILGAFFMATDYSTSPMSNKGQYIYAIGAGLLTALIRHFGGMPEGVSYSILLMNVATPLIDKYVVNKPFGGETR